MIAWLRFATKIVSMVFHVAAGLAIAATAFPFTDDAWQQRTIRWWARRLLAILDVRVRLLGPAPGATAALTTIEGALQLGGPGAMLILNHVSWLDIFVVNSQRPAHFVAKVEISRWPLLGFLVRRSGTMFIERGKRHAVREINQRIVAQLEGGSLVGMFPEGTTGDGDHLLPFHANLIEPAISAGVPIVVGGVRYRDDRGAPTDAMLYVGDITLLQSLFRLARHGPLVAELHLIDILDSNGATRHAIGRKARNMIAAALNLDDDARDAAESVSSMNVVAEVISATSPGGTEPGTPFDPRDEAP